VKPNNRKIYIKLKIFWPMHFKYHLIISFLFSLLLYPVFGIASFLVFFIGVAVDIDHYLITLVKFNMISMMDSVRYYINVVGRKFHYVGRNYLFIFHTVEFLVLFVLLYFLLPNYSVVFLMLSAGISIHIIMDWIYDYFIAMHDAKSPSVIFWLIKNLAH
jgi:hypothetical protein